jgi:arylsulfatase A-like enzyme
LFVRAPGLLSREETQIVNNVDLAATMLEFAGTEMLYETDGRSFHDLLYNPAASWENESCLEYLASGRARNYTSIVTEEYLYGEYQNGNAEQYDRRGDLFQLSSLVKTASAAPAELRQKIQSCRGQ